MNSGNRKRVGDGSGEFEDACQNPACDCDSKAGEILCDCGSGKEVNRPALVITVHQYLMIESQLQKPTDDIRILANNVPRISNPISAVRISNCARIRLNVAAVAEMVSATSDNGTIELANIGDLILTSYGGGDMTQAGLQRSVLSNGIDFSARNVTVNDALVPNTFCGGDFGKISKSMCTYVFFKALPSPKKA